MKGLDLEQQASKQNAGLCCFTLRRVMNACTNCGAHTMLQAAPRVPIDKLEDWANLTAATTSLMSAAPSPVFQPAASESEYCDV